MRDLRTVALPVLLAVACAVAFAVWLVPLIPASPSVTLDLCERLTDEELLMGEGGRAGRPLSGRVSPSLLMPCLEGR